MPTSIKMNSINDNAQDTSIKSETPVKRNIVRRTRGIKPSLLVEKKLLRKLNKAVNNYFNVLGKQVAVVAQSPNRSELRIFGGKRLVEILRKLRTHIDKDLKDSICEVATDTSNADGLFELPALTIDGVPIPLQNMTQSNLRSFIPLMLKYSTGRGKPGWCKELLRPAWWPSDMPWANVRVDCRTEEDKRRVPWTAALRNVIRNCYIYHGREDLLEKSEEFYRRVSNFNPDFVSFNDPFKRHLEIPVEDMEISKVEEEEYDEDVAEEEDQGGDRDEEINTGADYHTVIIQSDQPYYIYNVQDTIPVYAFPVDVVFSGEELVTIDPDLNTSHATIQEITDDSIEDSEMDGSQMIIQETTDGDQCDSVVDIPEEETSNEVTTIQQNVDSPQECERSELGNEARQMNVIFVNDITKIEYNLEESYEQNVIILDGEYEEGNFLIIN